MIDLGGATRLGRGNGRDCYVHPLDSGLVIKVPRPDRPSRDQNRLERLYLSSLLRRGVPFDHIPQPHGQVHTTLGEGLVCERIADPDGRPCLSLVNTVRRGLLTRARTEALLDELLAYLLRHWIVFVDTGGGNLVWQWRSDGTGRLVMIDGLGSRHPNLRLWLRIRLAWVARRKMRKQWPRLLQKVRDGYA